MGLWRVVYLWQWSRYVKIKGFPSILRERWKIMPNTGFRCPAHCFPILWHGLIWGRWWKLTRYVPASQWLFSVPSSSCFHFWSWLATPFMASIVWRAQVHENTVNNPNKARSLDVFFLVQPFPWINPCQRKLWLNQKQAVCGMIPYFIDLYYILSYKPIYIYI